MVAQPDVETGSRDDNDDDSWRATFATYAQHTTAHGIGRVYGTRSARRLLWGCLVLFSVCFVLTQIVILINKFLEYSIATELRVSYNRHMKFPAVTVCNLNALRLSKVIDPRYLPRDLLISMPGLRQNVVSVYRARPWLLNYTGLATANLSDPYLVTLRDDILAPSSDEEPLQNLTHSADIVDILNALNIPVDKVMEVEPGRLKQALYAVLLAYIDEDIVSRVGHQAQSFIYKCAFNGIRCNYTQFRQFETDSYGNCFTFNSGEDGKSLMMGYSGPKHALRLELNVEQYEYVTFLQETAGARIVIHDQGIRPFPQEEGITIAPGYHTSIGINRNGITRLGRPHGNCTHGDNQDKLPGYNYSVMACLKLCLDHAVATRCQCRVPLLPSANTHLPVCRFDNHKDDYLCMLGVASEAPSQSTSCLCPESCHELSFNPLLSFGDWPNVDNDKKALKQFIKVKDPLLQQMPEDHNLAHVRANMLRVDLYYQELNDIQIVQKESYGWLSLVSDIGGQMGLWIGMSVLSLCEGFELILDILKVLLLKSSQTNTHKPTSNKPAEVSPHG